MESPYEFNNAANHRMVTNVQDASGKVTASTALIYLTSLGLYSRHILRVNGNVVNAAGFAALSLPAAYAYSKTMFDSAENEAAALNNSQEK